MIGPSAGPCCYEVGPDVAGRLDSSSVHRVDGKLFADLKAETNHRLTASGVRAVERIDDCTICGESRYFSHRRDGVRAGRMMGFIVIKGKA